MLLQLAATSFSDGFQQDEKRLSKRKRFPRARKSVSTNRIFFFCDHAGMKDFVEKYFSVRRKKNLSLVGISEKFRNNGFHLPETQLSTCWNNLSPTIIFLKNCIPPYFNNVFHKQKESSRIRAWAE